MSQTDYQQHMRKYLELLYQCLKEVDLAAKSYNEHDPGPIAYTKRELQREAEDLEDKIVSLENMLRIV